HVIPVLKGHSWPAIEPHAQRLLRLPRRPGEAKHPKEQINSSRSEGDGAWLARSRTLLLIPPSEIGISIATEASTRPAFRCRSVIQNSFRENVPEIPQDRTSNGNLTTLDEFVNLGTPASSCSPFPAQKPYKVRIVGFTLFAAHRLLT
ncbi:unnamed protein product, partial [Ectocarpus sp. 6 AP-2014]